MKVKVLGCGGSLGVPVIGCGCEVCRSNDMRDSRTRSCARIETDDGEVVFIDTSPDFRTQILRDNIDHKVSGVIYTHIHSDHVNGINDLRVLNPVDGGKYVELLTDSFTLSQLKVRFPNLFMDFLNPVKGTKFSVKELLHYQSNMISGIKVLSFPQPHGTLFSNGLVFDNFAYCTDLSELPEKAFPYLHGMEVLFLECIGYDKYLNHTSFDEMVAIVKRLKPKLTVTIHMNHVLGYVDLANRMEAAFRYTGLSVVPCYDGFEIEV